MPHNPQAPHGALHSILLVEDNPNDVELSLSALKEARLANEIIVANDGEQALDYLYRKGKHAGRTTPNPAVILLDLKMPKVDGHEVLRQIRLDPYLRLIPVVILTSSREEKDLYSSYDKGANAYVVKPVDFEEFITAISKLGVFWAVLNEPPPGRGPS
ncbi:MAG TPA: response regulator [Opitutaceae bacterium]|jgi:CheY-like chemotaxis protein